MGWWSQDEDGHSFAQADEVDMVWGDSVADILDNALSLITEEFRVVFNRKPTDAELLAGMRFSLGGREGG